ncbi:beta-galactosidase [Mahella sp.]|uniref:beta-galactosidase n=1 Tax=Mahella sp. TaxID=2798721 RepID=UPI0025C320E2|nr:beta-galactosidase [Mahella sp.]MBZ4665139.1 beta-galactosidase [Mahella sp.]
MDKKIDFKDLTMGVCYYPEQWGQSFWESDLERMLDSGIRVIRIGEFAWNKFEPAEGEFTFEFFDEFMNVARKHGMKVIFGTPTATPPAWASENYPEILNATKDGILYRHGSRRHYNYNSPKYIELTKTIVEKLAQHYGHDDAVIGWQIDNELNCELDEFYSESDTVAFREFLKEKYITIDALNEAWGTVFWNQTYNDWNQVYVPRRTPNDSPNPHQVLDYIRFISHSLCRYAGIQSKILRRLISPKQFITTNGIFGNVDNHRLVKESLDFMTFDSYPDFAYALSADPKHSDDLNDRKWSRRLTEVRSLSSNFGVMEQQTGAIGWNTRMEAPMPKPGQITLWSMQSVAHGADYVGFFRWRTSVMGTEIYWHGILDYNNKDNRRLAEVRDISNKFGKISSITGAKYKASFAIVKEYDNIWDARYDVWHRRVEDESEKGWFNASQLAHIPMDYVYITEDATIDTLSKYPLLVYPHATILKKATADLLKAYVENGGTLLMGCRTGYKDESGKCVMRHMTGYAADICGVDLSEYTFVGPADDKVNVLWDDAVLEAAVFNDVLKPICDTVDVIGTYDSNYYKGQPGLTVNSIGKGKAYYFGGAFTGKTAEIFLKKLGIESPFAPFIDAPAESELAIREKEDEKYMFVLNFTDGKIDINLKQPMLDMFTGKQSYGEVELGAFETKVFML